MNDDKSRADLEKECAMLRYTLSRLITEAYTETPSGKTQGYVYANTWKWARRVLNEHQ